MKATVPISNPPPCTHPCRSKPLLYYACCEISVVGNNSPFCPLCLEGQIDPSFTQMICTIFSKNTVVQKSSKSEKILDRDPLCTNFGTIRTNFGTPVPILVRSVPILVRSASGSVLVFPLRHSEVLSGAFAVSLRLRWGLEPWSSRRKFSSLTSRAYLRLLRSVLCFDQGDPAYQYWPGPISVRLLRLLRRWPLCCHVCAVA